MHVGCADLFSPCQKRFLNDKNQFEDKPIEKALKIGQIFIFVRM
jgi:hypothetical protein